MDDKTERILAIGWELLFLRMRQNGFTKEQIRQVTERAVEEIERIECDPLRPREARLQKPSDPVMQ